MEYIPSFSDQLDVDYISHHGIKGMHWGVRRYQNPDGTLTPAGKKRYDEQRKLLEKAEQCDKAVAYMKTRVKKDMPFLKKAAAKTQISKLEKMSADIRRQLDPDIVSKIERDRKIELKKKKAAEEKEWHNSSFSRRYRFMDDAMHEVFGPDTKSDFMNVYREMSKDKRFKNLLDSEDNDDYKEAEVAWLKKHGYWEAYLDAIYNGYKDME